LNIMKDGKAIAITAISTLDREWRSGNAYRHEVPSSVKGSVKGDSIGHCHTNYSQGCTL
jgi:hypothetical protein